MLDDTDDELYGHVVMEHEREAWDRRSRLRFLEEIMAIRTILEDVRTEAKLTNGRLTRAEEELIRHRTMLYGSGTDLQGHGGIVGMLRQLRNGQRTMVWVITAVAVPAALTVLASYLPALLGGLWW